MPLKIENKPVDTTPKQGGSALKEFIDTLSELEKGQSFVTPSKLSSQCSVAMQVMGLFLDRTFRAKKEGDGYRVGRIE
jgi:hypothetical protein